MKEFETRRSIRKYKDTPVADEQIAQIMEAVRIAPSGENLQPWFFMAVKDPALKKAIIAADHNQSWMESAPVILVCLGDVRCRIDEVSCGAVGDSNPTIEVKRTIVDTSIALTYAMLEAESMGLSTCWTQWYDQNSMKKALGVPDYYYVGGVMTLGYADEAPSMRPRKELKDIYRII